MNKPKVFKVLYYICFVVFMFLWMCVTYSYYEYGVANTLLLNTVLGVINVLLAIIFSFKIAKCKLTKINILFPILELTFSVIVVLMMFIINDKLVLPYLHFNYYTTFIIFNYILFNIYSLLSFEKRKKN